MTRAVMVVLALALSLLPLPAAPAASPNVASWLADFDELQHELALKYANLEWVVSDRRIDLPKLVAATQARIRTAGSDAEVRGTIEFFLAAFGDGHIEIEWPTISAPGGPPGKLPPLCQRLGYAAQTLSPGIDFARNGRFTPLATPGSRYFPTGILKLDGGANVAVLRLPVFSADFYPDLCQQAQSAMGLSDSSPCDDACDEAIELRTENALTENLDQALSVIDTVPFLDGLVVDITGNGGGSDWLEPAARELTAKRLRSPALGFVKGEHWQNILTRRLQAISADAATANGDTRDALLAAQRTYTGALNDAKTSCDRDGYFAGTPVACSQIVRDALTTAGVLAYAPPGAFRGLASARYLFAPSRFTYREGTYHGALVVLIDGDTASAAERFAAILQDGGAATIVGSPTLGAGCGSTDGGSPGTLDHSGAVIRMPDCVQYRADGSDAVAGVTPNLLVPWRDNDSAYQRFERAYAALSAIRFTR